ncbi:hypothetical protein NCC49_006327 [Naganishia albida]|nr:hypothetical protein NCC49_006327 [Naganishia albida]
MFRRRYRVNPYEATNGSEVTESSPLIDDTAEYNSEEEWVDLGSTSDPSQQIPEDSRKLAAEASGFLSSGSKQLLEAIRLRDRIQAVVSNPRSWNRDRYNLAGPERELTKLIQELEPSSEWHVLPGTMNRLCLMDDRESNHGVSFGSKSRSQAPSDDIRTHPLYIRQLPDLPPAHKGPEDSKKLADEVRRYLSTKPHTKAEDVRNKAWALRARIQAVHTNPAHTGEDSLNLKGLESGLDWVIMKILGTNYGDSC